MLPAVGAIAPIDDRFDPFPDAPCEYSRAARPKREFTRAVACQAIRGIVPEIKIPLQALDASKADFFCAISKKKFCFFVVRDSKPFYSYSVLSKRLNDS